MEKFIDATALSKRWCCSKSSITAWRKRGAIPHFKPLGTRKVLFLVEDVERYEQQNMVEADEDAVLPTYKEWGHLI